MKVFILSESHVEHVILADTEKEAMKIYYEKFPLQNKDITYEGRGITYLNRKVTLYDSFNLKKGFIYSADMR